MEPLTSMFKKLVASKKMLLKWGLSTKLDVGEFNNYYAHSDAVIAKRSADDRDYTIFFLMDLINNPTIVIRSSLFGTQVGDNGYVTLTLKDRFVLDVEENAVTVRLGGLSTGWALENENEYLDYNRINDRCTVKNTAAKMLEYLKHHQENKEKYIKDSGVTWRDFYKDDAHRSLRTIVYYGGTDNFIVEYRVALMECE